MAQEVEQESVFRVHFVCGRVSDQARGYPVCAQPSAVPHSGAVGGGGAVGDHARGVETHACGA